MRGAPPRAPTGCLPRLATKFAGYAEGPEQAALANALFARCYQGVLPLLKDGGEALRENIEYYHGTAVITSEAAKQADQFNDTLGKITLNVTGLGRAMVADLLPA